MINTKISVLQQELIKTDVLVIGAGAGGMMAAISAADTGAEVVLCEKGCTRRSGGIPGGNDHFYCYIPGVQSDSVKENMIKQHTMTGLPESLVRKWFNLSYEVLKLWESWGIEMKINGHYEFTGHGWPGSVGKYAEPFKTDRFFLHFSDPNSCIKIEKQVRKKNVKIMNRVMVTELIKNNKGEISGAVGISTREPIFYVFSAKKVIINKGNLGTRLYPVPELIGYSMAEPASGDGVIAAYRAGAAVQDAEIQLSRQVSMRFGPFAGKGTWVGVVRDAEGKPIAPPYLTKPDSELGDVSIENHEALDHAWEMGRGPVWFDMRGISKEVEQYMRLGLDSESMASFMKWVDREKINLRKTRWEFMPRQYGTGLRLRYDTDCRTTIPGLFIIPWGLLSWSAVIGKILGKMAADQALHTKQPYFDTNGDQLRELKGNYEEILGREGPESADWREAQWAVFQTMHCYAKPPHRTENTLMAGYNRLVRIKNDARQIMKARNQHELYHCLEVLNIMDIAELVILAINERKESKGVGRRQDYPFQNPLITNKKLVITLENGRPSFHWENTPYIQKLTDSK
ncbi:MAG: FAD-binding protein [Dehalococcoidales bacterium]|nr:FAD-binding protein [Dehalococcoidales bacterium]